MKLLKQFIQQETVLTAAAVLAVVSAFFVPPDVQYLGYIDLRTLAILFSLMTVMAGLRRQGFFDGLGRALLSRTHSTFQLTLVLVGLCFFGSMFITNDVSLLTFVPFTFVVLSRLGADVRRALLIPVVCMQTIAANLGSMLTPHRQPAEPLSLRKKRHEHRGICASYAALHTGLSVPAAGLGSNGLPESLCHPLRG